MVRSPSSSGTMRVRRSSPNFWRRRGQLLADQRPPLGRAGQQEPFRYLMSSGQLLGLLAQLARLQRGEPAQRHVEDVGGLDLAELEPLHEGPAGRLGVGRGADDLDHLVDVVEGDEQAVDDVRPGLGLGQAEPGAPLDHLHLVIEVVADDLLDVEGARHPVDQGHHVDPEGLLQLGVLVQLVEHHLGHGVALELDDQPGAGAVGLVAQVGDAGDLALAHQLGDLLHDPVARHLVGDPVTTMAVRPLRTSSISAVARIFTEPRPVSRASRTPRLPTMQAPVGKSGPLTKRSRSSAVASGCSICRWRRR